MSEDAQHRATEFLKELYATGLAPVKIEEVTDAGQEPPGRRWLAEFRRPGG